MIDTDKSAQDIINNKRWVKINSVWDYRANYNGRRALIRRSGGVTVAIAGMRPPQRECDEFYVALEIVNRVQEMLDRELDKP